MPDTPKQEITDLLVSWRGGDEAALGELIPQIYRQLKEMASHLLRRERVDHTLQTTALVHEAYTRLVDIQRVHWQDRAHFFAISAQVMRRVLVDHARRHGRSKRGGDMFKVSLGDLQEALPFKRDPYLVDLDQALRDLADRDPQAARIVELRFFGGLNRDELAEVLGISSASVTRRWRMARAWLFRSLSQEWQPSAPKDG